MEQRKTAKEEIKGILTPPDPPNLNCPVPGGHSGRKLSLDEINHYMKVARAIELTIELQGKVNGVYGRLD